MKSSMLAAAVLLALPMATPAATPGKKAAKPAGQHNWLATTARTAEGAIVVGNPAAKVKLVEYLSLTCSHCAQLSAEMLPSLQRDYIARGLVSLEVRHAVRDGYDFAASLLLRCEPPARYLASIEALFAKQAEWMAKGQSAAAIAGFDSKSPDEKMLLVARAAGFDSFFAQRGLTPKAFAACMADDNAQKQLAQMAGNSWERDAIPGTPLLLINGVRQGDVHSWAALEPLIKAALK
ncbi:thioredoxin domain-containing protein [Rhizorhabdus sp.]|uniref:thioredoxin domain-containing protein n=1 Tax=Rhizorhabdus sp. TaxID=1968843 RepID=UPI0019888999|nr:thioredoxin domain-containing protein [Rhizorhabdus sp.]MBD3760041.1 thioredoxin domain-containing protein [Rhizorhabdus sp.]